MNALDTMQQSFHATRRNRVLLFTLLVVLLLFAVVIALSVGAYAIPVKGIFRILAGEGSGTENVVLYHVRLPRIAAAVAAGWALALSGTLIQTLLHNELASPFTLGISHGAAFGAAFAIVVLGAGSTVFGEAQTSAGGAIMLTQLHLVSIAAFTGAMGTTFIILALSGLRAMTPQSIVLAGVALSSLFTSGTILLQYFADELQLASIVFWTFGDVSRSGWNEIAILFAVLIPSTIVALLFRWDLNALRSGDEVARSLGVAVTPKRISLMVIASLLASLAVAFHGVIGFLGLLAPHIGRQLVGENHTLLVPVSSIMGALLLVMADTAGKIVVGSGTLPVGVITSFMGAPLFLYLLMRKQR